MSFGSIVELNQPFVAAVHGGLQRIRARALWRIPSDQRPLLASLPPCETIRIETFVPQPEVLEHPAVRCFLTQGGAWSVQEAWLAGTPMVVIPFFADQPYNASLVQQLGVGLRLWRSEVNAESVGSAITAVLDSERYRDNAARLKTDLLENDGAEEVAEFVERSIGRIRSASGGSAGQSATGNFVEVESSSARKRPAWSGRLD